MSNPSYVESIRPGIIESLRRYGEHKTPTGDFLHAVLCNDLREACARADDGNRKVLFEIVAYCYYELPSASWGSREKVEKWLNSKLTETT